MKKMLVVLYCLLFIIYPVLSDAGPIIFNSDGGGSGTVTSVNAANNTPGITVSGGPITSVGTLQIGVSNNLQLWNAFTPSVLNCGVNAINSVANNGSVTCVAPGAGGGGTVTSINAANNTPGITVSGTPITSSGTLQIGVSSNLQLWSAFAPSVISCGVNAINSMANNGTVTCTSGSGNVTAGTIQAGYGCTGNSATSINCNTPVTNTAIAPNTVPAFNSANTPILATLTAPITLTSAGALALQDTSPLNNWNLFQPSVLNCGVNAINSVANNGSVTCVAPGTGGGGTVTSINAANNTPGITVSGTPITSSGTLQIGVSSDLQLWSAFAPSVLNCGTNAINSVANNGALTCVATGNLPAGSVNVTLAPSAVLITDSGNNISFSNTLPAGLSLSSAQLATANMSGVTNIAAYQSTAANNNIHGTVISNNCSVPYQKGNFSTAITDTHNVTNSGGSITYTGDWIRSCDSVLVNVLLSGSYTTVSTTSGAYIGDLPYQAGGLSQTGGCTVSDLNGVSLGVGVILNQSGNAVIYMPVITSESSHIYISCFYRL